MNAIQTAQPTADALATLAHALVSGAILAGVIVVVLVAVVRYVTR